MGKLYLKTRGGRKPRLEYVDGDMVQIKPLTKVGNSVAVILPKEWLNLTKVTMGKCPKKVTLQYNVSDLASVITLRAYFEEEET